MEDFIARTRETPAKWKWRFDNGMVDRYIEKIVVGEGEMVVRFKGGGEFYEREEVMICPPGGDGLSSSGGRVFAFLGLID